MKRFYWISKSTSCRVNRNSSTRNFMEMFFAFSISFRWCGEWDNENLISKIPNTLATVANLVIKYISSFSTKSLEIHQKKFHETIWNFSNGFLIESQIVLRCSRLWQIFKLQITKTTAINRAGKNVAQFFLRRWYHKFQDRISMRNFFHRF